MSIIIKGMDMPIECGNCDFFREDYGHPYCFITEKHITFIGEIADFCPLIEIPTPHGRLIDADDFIDVCEMLADKNDDRRPFEQAEWIVKDMQTIIEAEE